MRLFDSHLHVIDPRFPLVPNRGYLPPSFTCDDYRQSMQAHQLLGGVVVSGSFQANGRAYLLDALQTLGKGFVGVVQLESGFQDQDILALNRQGVRALRFNVHRGGSHVLRDITDTAMRIYELCEWHVELYVDARLLGSLHSMLTALPAVSIDHLGLSQHGFSDLLRLAERGVRVKATGFGRCNMDVARALKELHAVNPAVLMFGSDLPSTRAPRPFQESDIRLIVDTLGEVESQRVLWRNGMEFYRMPESTQVVA